MSLAASPCSFVCQRLLQQTRAPRWARSSAGSEPFFRDMGGRSSEQRREGSILGEHSLAMGPILCLFTKYDQPGQHIKKLRHHFADKGPFVKAVVFPVVMYRCESWTIKKAECQRIDAFKLSGWRRLLRVPWTARKSDQSNLRKLVLNIHWKD